MIQQHTVKSAVTRSCLICLLFAPSRKHAGLGQRSGRNQIFLHDRVARCGRTRNDFTGQTHHPDRRRDLGRCLRSCQRISHEDHSSIRRSFIVMSLLLTHFNSRSQQKQQATFLASSSSVDFRVTHLDPPVALCIKIKPKWKETCRFNQ